MGRAFADSAADDVGDRLHHRLSWFHASGRQNRHERLAERLEVLERGIHVHDPEGVRWSVREAVAAHDILLYETFGGMPGFEWLKDSGGSVTLRANDPSALVSAATAGLGLVALPCMLGDREPSLARVTSLGFEHCDLFMVTPEPLRTVPRVRAVADFVAEILREHRAIIEG